MLKVAIIGLGWWGKTLVTLAATSKKIVVVRVVDVNPAMAAFAAEKNIAFSTQFEDALADSNVQGIVLCTPHTQHTDQIIACAKSKKHVFCEKPLSMTRAAVLRAVEAVEAAGVTLAVGHEKRFEPPVVELMALLTSGALGVPLQVEANFSQDKFLSMAPDNWRLSPEEAPAGPMTATGVHLLDLSIGVFGDAKSVFASVKQLGSSLTNGDTLAALVTFKNGGHALITAILATPFAGRFAVYGSKGWAEIRDKTHPEAPEGWTLTTCLRGSAITVKDLPPAPAVLYNLEAFADAVQGGPAYPVPHSQMIANVSALEAIFKSAKSGAIEAVG
jgi:predicted dehydrogenase